MRAVGRFQLSVCLSVGVLRGVHIHLSRCARWIPTKVTGCGADGVALSLCLSVCLLLMFFVFGVGWGLTSIRGYQEEDETIGVAGFLFGCNHIWCPGGLS